MRRIFQLGLAGIFFTVCGLVPASVTAQSITLDNVAPAVDEDITPPDNQKAAEENFYTFWFKGQIDTEYQAVFNVSEEPAMTFVSGGSMTLENNVAYNEATGEFTVTYTAKALEQIDSQSGLTLEDNQTLTIVAISFPVAEGEAGPSEDTTGAWLSTAFQEWTVITPSQDSNAMGATVQGDAGDAGQFTMFMPTRTLNTMAEYDGEDTGTYQADDFAIFEDDSQITGDVTAVTGGAMVDFETVIPEQSSDDSSNRFIAGEGPGVRQKVTVAPRPAISLTASADTVQAGETVILTGTIKIGKKGRRVILEKMTESDATYRRIKMRRTKKGGEFMFRIKVKEPSAFRARLKQDYSGVVIIGVTTSLTAVQASETSASAIDMDGDTFPDCVEKKSYRDDQDNDGIVDDEDDTVDELTESTDRDADGIPDVIERDKFRRNHDNDARKDLPDLDDDNDGELDKTEESANKRNHDNDDTKDKKDADDDNDDILDLTETSCAAQYDHDNDDTVDKKDDDDDADGITDDEDEHPMDHDNDGEDDINDSDDDNDDIADEDDDFDFDEDNNGEDDDATDEDANESEEDNDDDNNNEDTIKIVDVAIQNFAFSPATITVSVGDTVRWTNQDSSSHTASEENGVFNTGTLAPGATKTITMNKAGTYSYFCAFHPSMVGTVVVEE